MPRVPQSRICEKNSAPVRPDGRWVLYWMTAARRTRYNFSFQRAVERAREFGRPLLVLETLACGSRWATARHHQFVMQGMADNARRLRDTGVSYYAFVETRPDQGKRLAVELARRACAVVTDDFPCEGLPGLIAEMARESPAQVEAVDSNGLLPLRAAGRVYPTAYAFRRFVQQELPTHLAEKPAADPLAGFSLPALRELPGDVTERFAPAAPGGLARGRGLPEGLPIHHGVSPVVARGGPEAAGKALRAFLSDRLDRYSEDRNNPDPEQEAASGLSPYLHFGHVAAHEVFERVARREGWTPGRLGETCDGRREGWWGMSAPAESFLDQLVVWRELGFNMAWQRADHDRFESLPDWATRTLRKHARDQRSHVYGLEQFEAAATHDGLWNAAQRQLVREGRLHNYLRMLWGKKVLEWSATPEEALDTMIELNNKYALDGCDPNSYSGIFWVLGRYDRPWGPERPVFGTVRYMSSENTARKVPVRAYLARYGPSESGSSSSGAAQ